MNHFNRRVHPVMYRLQLLLATGRCRAGAGRSNRGSGRGALGSADRCNRGSRGSAGGRAGGNLTGSLGCSSGSVLTSLAGRARGAGSRVGGDRGERRSVRGCGDSAGAGTDGSRAKRSLGLLGSETELVQSVVVVVTEAGVRVVSSLGVVVAGRRGGSTIGASSLVLGVVAGKTGGVLASESSELVALAALGNGNAVLVEPLLDLAVRPAVEELVGKALLSVSGLLGSGVVLLVGFLSSNVRVAADGGDEGVAGAGLGNGNTTLVTPSLQIRVGPLSVEPLAGVGSGLTGLVRGGLVVRADSGEKRVASARLRVGDTVVVEESLELRVGPADPC